MEKFNQKTERSDVVLAEQELNPKEEAASKPETNKPSFWEKYRTQIKAFALSFALLTAPAVLKSQENPTATNWKGTEVGNSTLQKEYSEWSKKAKAKGTEVYLNFTREIQALNFRGTPEEFKAKVQEIVEKYGLSDTVAVYGEKAVENKNNLPGDKSNESIEGGDEITLDDVKNSTIEEFPDGDFISQAINLEDLNHIKTDRLKVLTLANRIWSIQEVNRILETFDKFYDEETKTFDVEAANEWSKKKHKARLYSTIKNQRGPRKAISYSGCIKELCKTGAIKLSGAFQGSN